ncbi:hypothetical protein FQN60_006578, partial [Etheostoma spectabile]
MIAGGSSASGASSAAHQSQLSERELGSKKDQAVFVENCWSKNSVPMKAFCQNTKCLSKRLTFRDVQSPQEFRHGETAEVVCDVISSPVPVVVWYYQDKEITEEHHSRFQVLTNNNLQIQQVTKADEGVYRCEASVEARGEIDFVDIAMVVNGEL